MKRISSDILIAASLLAASANAQTQAFEIHPVVTPDTIIEGQILGKCVSLKSPVLNDLGEYAFTAYCQGIDRLFTSHRIVVSQGDHIDGKLITSLYEGTLVINNHGQVLYEAFYSDTDNYDLINSRLGLFLGQHLLSVVEYDSGGRTYEYDLSEDGRVTAEIVDPVLQPPTGERGKDRAYPPIRAYGLNPHTTKRRKAEGNTAAPPFATNRKGEFLIPVERPDSRSALLLASPVKH